MINRISIILLLIYLLYLSFFHLITYIPKNKIMTLFYKFLIKHMYLKKLKKSSTVIMLILLQLLSTAAKSAEIKGKITDAETKEALMGAIVMIDGSNIGTMSDYDGNFVLQNVPTGSVNLSISYISYITEHRTVNITTNKEVVQLDFMLKTDLKQLSEVTIVERKSLENQQILISERKNSSAAIENIGANEMSEKGISNVADGVKKLSGISVASAGQLIVRGLGDRYSTTTLNGLPIASPNPDNKLIPLDIFPTSTVKNITVIKVFNACYFADYSGAHVDISTRENIGNDFLNISASIGSNTLNIGKSFYSMDKSNSLFTKNKLNKNVYEMSKKDFENYVKTTDVFETNFDVNKNNTMPDFGINLVAGKTWKISNNNLNVLVSANLGNENQIINNAYFLTLEAGGNILSKFNYDSYTQTLKQAALANINYSLRTNDRISYTFLYARNASNNYILRTGKDYEDHNLIGSNSVTHIYSLINHQLIGFHEFNKGWSMDWSASFGNSSSEEPDRRQIMFITNNDTEEIKIFKLNKQETMRYFGSLNENEINGKTQAQYKFSNENKIIIGVAIKNKQRNYQGIRFYYNLNKINPLIESVYETSSYINQENTANNNITIERNMQPKDSYNATTAIYSAFTEGEIKSLNNWLIYLGLRFENCQQIVNYSTDGGRTMTGKIIANDFFPALNLRYLLTKNNVFRFSLSRTITRPSFIEMSPFLYQESYGSAQIRGNADLKNGYNYNVDLRYEYINLTSGFLFATTLYYKFLDDPIERVQSLAGGSAVHSFQNANNGQAAGFEMEFRKKLNVSWQIGLNTSIMYTNVKLPENGSYTNEQRSLQGASPYLANADITYSKKIKESNIISIALLYNLQGPRIHAVGISGLGDIKQKTFNTLNLNASYSFAEHWLLGIKLNNIINQSVKFEQEVPKTSSKLTVEEYKIGISGDISIKYEF